MKNLSKYSLALSLATIGAAASAAVPADVTTAITDMKADTAVVAIAFTAVIIGLRALKMLRRA
jgi:hypothetical protein